MKFIKRVFLLLLSAVLIVAIYNFPRLNIIAGYSAKNTSSSVFLANRSLAFTDVNDNNLPSIKLASDVVDVDKKTATASVFGLLSRKAIHRKGTGSVLITTDFDKNKPVLIPKRSKPNNTTPFPYGNADQKDTVFSNINYKNLTNIVTDAFADGKKTRAVLVIYKNQIIAEKYADGFDKNSKILGWSMTKSITATIYGILQHQQKLNIADKAPIASWQNDDRKEITINNLLQMNSGLEWDEDYDNISDVTKMLFLHTDMAKSQENKPFAGKINKSWNYSSGTSNLLSGMLRSYFTNHQAYLDFWYTNLIDKIGMNSMLIETDVAGNYVGSSYGWATPRDWAKFGLLYLHNGNWQGEQLFDKSWVEYVQTPTETSNGEYGGHFWLNRGGIYKDLPKNVYSINGYQGQRVFMFPDKELVVVRMGLASMDFNEFLSEVLKTVQ